MNKTKRIFVAIAAVLVALMCVMLVGCSGETGNTPAVEHSLTRVAPKAATCTEAGNREYFTCSDCDVIFADAEGMMVLANGKHIIPAKGHKVAKHTEHSATCFAEGTREHYECRYCSTLFSDAEGKNVISAPETIPTLSHSLTKVDAKQPSGFVSGWEEHYECANCDKLFKDASAKVETTMEAIKIAPSLTDFEYKIAFTPAANIESINGSGGADYISAAYTTDSNGLPATRFTFKAGARSGHEVEAWIIHSIGQAMQNGQNLRIPTFSGQPRTLDLTVTNEGNQSVTFRYYAESWGDKGGIDITIGAGQTRTFTFEVNPGDSIGANFALKLLSEVTEQTSIVMNGFFHCEGEVTSVSIYKAASKTTFKVGEKFTSDGFVLKANGNKYDDVVIANFLTSIEEGYTFTASDVGTKTVTVAYGEYSVTYDITITN